MQPSRTRDTEGARAGRRRRALATVLGAALALAPAVAASADTSWMQPGEIYDAWNPAQYDRCRVQTVEPLEVAAEDVEFSMPAPATLRPAACVDFGPVQMVNTADEAVRLTFAGTSADGTIAPYLFRWTAGWSDLVLEPGASSPEFTLSVGMPCDVPNAAQGTTGEFAFRWDVLPVVEETPITAPDLTQTITLGDEAEPFDVLAAAGAPADTTVAVDGDPAVWALDGDRVRPAPPTGFTGTLTAGYTLTAPGGASASGTLTLVVLPPEPATIDDVWVETPFETPVDVPLGPGWTYEPGQPGVDGARVEMVDGVLRYAPAPGFTGSDVVRITATDAWGRTVTFLVHVRVGPPPTPAPPVEPPAPAPPAPAPPAPAPPGEVGPGVPAEPTPPGADDLAVTGLGGLLALAGLASALVLGGVAAPRRRRGSSSDRP